MRRRRSVASATVNPSGRVTTTIDVSANTEAREATNSRFSVRSKSRLRRWPNAYGPHPAGLPYRPANADLQAPDEPGSPVRGPIRRWNHSSRNRQMSRTTKGPKFLAAPVYCARTLWFIKAQHLAGLELRAVL